MHGRSDSVLNVDGAVEVDTGDDSRGGLFDGDLSGQIWAGNDGDAGRVRLRHLGDHFAHPLGRAEIHPLHAADEGGGRWQLGCPGRHVRAQRLRRDGEGAVDDPLEPRLADAEVGAHRGRILVVELGQLGLQAR